MREAASLGREFEQANGSRIFLQHGAASSTFGSQAGTPLQRAWLFIEFATAHLFFDSTSFNKLPEPAYRLLDTFAVTNNEQ